MRTRAIFPGSFDPIHLGHMDILSQASRTFDSVIIALMNNSKKTTKFSLNQRYDIIANVLLNSELENVEFYVGRDNKLLVQVAEELRATHVVRSLRSGLDFEYEFGMTLVNRHLDPTLLYTYFMAEQEHLHISSTVVRELLELGADITPYVPQSVVDFIKLT